MTKGDIQDVFRSIPIHPAGHRLLGITWQNKCYFDKCLPMGCSKFCQTLECFAQPLQWILFTKFHVHSISHILDDFFLFESPVRVSTMLGLVCCNFRWSVVPWIFPQGLVREQCCDQRLFPYSFIHGPTRAACLCVMT